MNISHSVGNQGHALGASIDFRRPSTGVDLEPAPEKGSYTSIELNTSTSVSEWGDQKVAIMMEDDAAFKGRNEMVPSATNCLLLNPVNFALPE
jgi:hypothetical protein